MSTIFEILIFGFLGVCLMEICFFTIFPYFLPLGAHGTPPEDPGRALWGPWDPPGGPGRALGAHGTPPEALGGPLGTHGPPGGPRGPGAPGSWGPPIVQGSRRPLENYNPGTPRYIDNHGS